MRRSLDHRARASGVPRVAANSNMCETPGASSASDPIPAATAYGRRQTGSRHVANAGTLVAFLGEVFHHQVGHCLVILGPDVPDAIGLDDLARNDISQNA